MATAIKYPVAGLAGMLVWASEAAELDERPSGLLCVGCEEPVILRSGEHRRAHFAHRPGATCSGGETALHRTAIQVISEGVVTAAREGRAYPFKLCCEQCDASREGNLARDPECTVEIDRPLSNAIRPDILVRGGNGTARYVIEVVVTHSPEDAALTEYRTHDLPVIVVRPSWDTMESFRNGLTELETYHFTTEGASLDVLGRCRFPRHIEPEEGALRSCPACKQSARLVTLEVSEMACWSRSCTRHVRVLDTYALLDEERVLIAAGASDLHSSSTIAKELGVRLEMRNSKTAGTRYLANICECGALCGDNFAYGGFGGQECTPIIGEGVHRYVVCTAGHWTAVSARHWPDGINLGRTMRGQGLTGEVSGVLEVPRNEASVSVTSAEIKDIARMMAGVIRPRR